LFQQGFIFILEKELENNTLHQKLQLEDNFLNNDIGFTSNCKNINSIK